jgi:hypothetical protein
MSSIEYFGALHLQYFTLQGSYKYFGALHLLIFALLVIKVNKNSLKTIPPLQGSHIINSIFYSNISLSGL